MYSTHQQRTIFFNIDGMTCIVCEGAVKKTLNNFIYPENIAVLNSTANFLEGQARVTLKNIKGIGIDERTCTEIEEKLCDEIEDVGFDCHVIRKRKQSSQDILIGPSINTPIITSQKNPFRSSKEKKKKKKPGRLQSNLTKSLVSYLLGFTLLSLSLIGVSIPPVALGLIIALSFMVTLYGGWKHIKAAFNYLFKRRMLTMDSLFTISITLSWGLVLFSLALSFIPLTWPITALLIVAGMCGGKYLEKKYHEKIKKNIQLTTELPDKVVVINSNKRMLTEIKAVKIDDIIEVSAGQIIPLDGTYQGGEGEICTKVFNGRIRPERANQIRRFVSGMRVVSGTVRLKITTGYEHCYLVKLERRINESKASKTQEIGKLERFTGRLITIFIPTILIIAILTAMVAGYFLGPLAAIIICLSQLSGACPCVLGWIAPLGKKMALHKAAAYGARLASSSVLDSINQVDTYVFDLNGTLTMGDLTVSRCENSTGESNRTFFSILKMLEEKGNASGNIIGRAVLNYANEKLLNSLNIKEESSLQQRLIGVLPAIPSGVGISIDGVNYYLGNGDMLKHLAIHRKLKQSGDYDGHHLFLVKEKKIVGVIVLQDSLRTDSIQIIKALQKRGKKVFICTGTDKKTAKYYADKLGIADENIRASCINKEAYINTLRKNRHCKNIAMTGDALNDILAFKRANVSIATHGASKQNQELADICLNNPNLQPIIHTLFIAEDSANHIKAMLIFTMSYNFLVVVLPIVLAATLITINPALFVVAMFVQAALVLAFLWYKHNKAIAIDSTLSDSHTHPLFPAKKAHHLEPSIESNNKINESMATQTLEEETLNLMESHQI